MEAISGLWPGTFSGTDTPAPSNPKIEKLKYSIYRSRSYAYDIITVRELSTLEDAGMIF